MRKPQIFRIFAISYDVFCGLILAECVQYGKVRRQPMRQRAGRFENAIMGLNGSSAIGPQSIISIASSPGDAMVWSSHRTAQPSSRAKQT